MHVDYVTISGGLIEDLYHAFRLDYELVHHPKPLDVVLVAGYNDLVRGHCREFIYNGYKHFTDAVLSMGKQLHPNTPNTVAVASLMYPPQLSWFRDDGPEPYNYLNRTEKINWLNNKIHQLNLRNSAPIYPGFHTYGIRKSTRRFIDNFGQEHLTQVTAHRWEGSTGVSQCAATCCTSEMIEDSKWAKP